MPRKGGPVGGLSVPHAMMGALHTICGATTCCTAGNLCNVRRQAANGDILPSAGENVARRSNRELVQGSVDLRIRECDLQGADVFTSKPSPVDRFICVLNTQGSVAMGAKSRHRIQAFAANYCFDKYYCQFICRAETCTVVGPPQIISLVLFYRIRRVTKDDLQVGKLP
jgi:hypothetical protein